MRSPDRQAGFSLVELLVSLTVLLVVVTGVTKMMVENSKINKAEQLTAEVQSNARNCLAMIVQQLRSAGWDPANAGVPTVALDPGLGDDVSEIEVMLDLDGDGLTDALDEQVLIRHVGDQVVWRRSSDVTEPFLIVANHISNDADGDGTPEPMFVPDSAAAPTRITVTITARSSVPNPMNGEFIQYTVASDVTLRKTL